MPPHFQDGVIFQGIQVWNIQGHYKMSGNPLLQWRSWQRGQQSVSKMRSRVLHQSTKNEIKPQTLRRTNHSDHFCHKINVGTTEKKVAFHCSQSSSRHEPHTKQVAQHDDLRYNTERSLLRVFMKLFPSNPVFHMTLLQLTSATKSWNSKTRHQRMWNIFDIGQL